MDRDGHQGWSRAGERGWARVFDPGFTEEKYADPNPEGFDPVKQFLEEWRRHGSVQQA